MKKTILLFSALLIFGNLSAQDKAALVNPIIGTNGMGHTFPGACVPLGELKKLSEQRKLLFDEQLMQFAMGNCITLVDTNGNRKLYKQRQDQKIDAVAAMMDAYVAWKQNRDAFE